MNYVEFLSKLDYIVRPIIVNTAPKFAVKFYSANKPYFLRLFSEADIQSRQTEFKPLKIWDLDFQAPLFNSAGMFKYGQGYYNIAKIGAGAYISGTTTSLPRSGNKKLGVSLPFISLPTSHLAINWMGLPNLGHAETAKILSGYAKMQGCPIGASLATDPLLAEKEAISGLLNGLELYSNANVDFIEINESCPNVEHDKESEYINGLEKGMVRRLEDVSEKFLKNRIKNLPVIVKFSSETSPEQIPALIDLLITLGFDGVNFGNTATNYKQISTSVSEKEKSAFDYFTTSFGGGVSGNYLKPISLDICRIASKYLKDKNLQEEFHIIRTGGIEEPKDLAELGQSFSLAQWYTGFFSQFASAGFDIYKAMSINS